MTMASHRLFVALALLVVACLVANGLAQATTDSIRLCTRACSDGSSLTKCIDTFGSVQSGDCTAPNAFPRCPAPTTDLGAVYDLHENDASKPHWADVAQCETYRAALQSTPNLPAIATSLQSLTLKKRDVNAQLEYLLNSRERFEDYTQEELNELAALVYNRLPVVKRAAFEENARENLAALHGFAQFVRKYTQASESGVYTNSKCAGCSILVKGILNKGVSTACDAIASTLPSTLCVVTGPFASFCKIFFKSGMALTGADATLSTMCTSALKGVANSTGIPAKAQELCSQLTCTQPQKTTVTSESDITGTCTAQSTTTFNTRCEEFLTVLDLAERGICIAENLIKVIDAAGNPIEAGVEQLGALVTGETPPVAEAIQKLATACSDATVLRFTLPLQYACFFVLLALLSIHKS